MLKFSQRLLLTSYLPVVLYFECYIKGFSKLNEVLASKVISFVDQLIESDEWHFAPGLHLLIGTYTT